MASVGHDEWVHFARCELVTSIAGGSTAAASYASCYAFSGAALHLLICHEFAKASWC